jgi:hypothetical protein
MSLYEEKSNPYESPRLPNDATKVESSFGTPLSPLAVLIVTTLGIVVATAIPYSFVGLLSPIMFFVISGFSILVGLIFFGAAAIQSRVSAQRKSEASNVLDQ